MSGVEVCGAYEFGTGVSGSEGGVGSAASGEPLGAAAPLLPLRRGGSLIAALPLDWASLIGALIIGLVFLALASASFALARFDTALATIWLPNAAAVVFVLRARLPSELAIYPALFAASVLANELAGHPLELALVHSLASLANIAAVLWLTRLTCGARPDMSELHTLARFVMAGGLLGPVMSAAIAASAMGPDAAAIWDEASAWFLTESMGMVIIVPTVLLICDAIGRWRQIELHALPGKAGLLVASVICCVFVFDQSAYPLLFLILPLTLLHAFRLGSAGTAIHVTLLAAIAITMTWAGNGPIVEASASREVQLQLIQAFIAANFLTGLPFAAILAGRDRMLKELEAGKQSLDLLAFNISDAVLRYDRDGLCTYASPSVAEVLGEPPSAYLGQSMLERTREEARARILLARERLISGESQKERFTYRRLLDSEDATPVFIEAECAIQIDPGSGLVKGIVICAREVTERVELELLLTRARRKAENATNAKTEFLANMSHEIRTPMNGVLGFAELMLQGELDPEQRRNAEMIVRSGRSLMLLLNDILDLSKAESGQITIDHAPFDLAATLDECVALHQPAAREKGLRIELTAARPNIAGVGAGVGAAVSAGAGFEQAPARRPHVLTDGLRLRQIVLNLIGNAIKFTQHGMVRVVYETSAHETRIRVEDTGIGISPARQETIFLPFSQEESSTTRRFGGTGLGLSISRQLAFLLGGTLEVDSTPGVGSAFTLTLPAELVGASEPGRPEDQEGEPGKPPLDVLAPARILLVEDHDVNRLLAVEMLRRCGQEVAIAHDGNEAISMVIESMVRERPFDLVLMDVQMPGCDGYSATRAIREEGISPDLLPIIALTANAYPEDIAAARAAGMQAHLAKPLGFAELARVLQRWLPTQIVEEPMALDFPAQPLPEAGEDKREAARADVDRTSEDANLGDCRAPDLALATRRSALHEVDSAPGFNEASHIHDSARAAARVIHSPALRQRWLARRSEAIAAVGAALAHDLFAAPSKAAADAGQVQNGQVDHGQVDHCRADQGATDDGMVGPMASASRERDRLIRLLHKVAGTAAIFGEAELGQLAAELERGLKLGLDNAVLEQLAGNLIAHAQSPVAEPSYAKRGGL